MRKDRARTPTHEGHLSRSMAARGSLGDDRKKESLDRFSNTSNLRAPSSRLIAGTNVYSKRGIVIGFIGGVYVSAKAGTLCRVIGVDPYLGTGRCHLDEFHLINGLLVLDTY